MTEHIFDTTHYTIVIGESRELNAPVYQVINKEHNLVENEFFVLPAAIRWAVGASKDLSTLLKDAPVEADFTVVADPPEK